jgi:tetratricopeptide (TPR) repeat protein/serine/threonine protein kinase
MASPKPNLRELFSRAAEFHTAEEQAAFLDQACRGDAELRAQVEELLRAQSEAGSFLQEPSALPAVTVDEVRVSERPGTVIGPYKLLQQLGEGGMGTVFMAEQTQPVQRKVALKLIKSGMDSQQVLARFEAERQALALMDHPNIAKVHDGGTTADGRPYFVMELVKGVPITRYCDEHHLTPRQRLELFVPVCQAVQHAHQKGIIHRDLKPSNVMVCLYDGKPVPKVIDFGVAKAAGPRLTEKTLFTEVGSVVGTLEYMSPEQAELNQLDVDTRSDIYSLGVLLYELLTGSTPLERNRLKAAALLEVLRLIREEEPPRPSTRLSTTDEMPSVAANRGLEPKKLSGVVRGELDWIVMKALEKDRNRRYETANGFAMDVQRYLHDEPVLACPPSGWYRFRKFTRRNRAKLAFVAGAFLAAAVMTASVAWAVRDRAAHAAEIERAETARRAQVESRVRDSLSAARNFVAENNLTAARQKLAEARAQIGTDRPALGLLAAEVEAGEADLDRFQQFLDFVDRAHQAEASVSFQPAVVLVRADNLVVPLPPARNWERYAAQAVPFRLKALACYEILERQDWSTTLERSLLGPAQVVHLRQAVYEELLWLADDALHRNQDHRSGQYCSPESAARLAGAYLGKAEGAHLPTQGFYRLRVVCWKALGEEERARLDEQQGRQTPPTMALDHYLRGRVAYYAHRREEGTKAFEAALSLEPTHYWSLLWLGYCLCDLGQGREDYAAAAGVFSGCIMRRPDHAQAYYCRANAYHKLHRNEEAVADFSRAIQLDPKFAAAWGNRGEVYQERGQEEQAFNDINKAIELEPQHAAAWIRRGNAHLALGQFDQAVADYSAAINLDPKKETAWNNRGVAYHKLHQLEKALENYSRAIELDAKDSAAWLNRGHVNDDLCRPEKAVADYSTAIKLNLKDAVAWFNRGCFYLNGGQWEEAVADFSNAIKLDQWNANYWNNRGNGYDKLRRFAEALADYSVAVQLDPKLAGAWNNRGGVFYDLGQPANAVADYTKAIELDERFVGAWFMRAAGYWKLGQRDKALADYSKSLELKPQDADVLFDRARLYGEMGQWDKAVADYSLHLELRSQHAAGWFGRAHAHQNLGNWDKAVADYDQAIALNPKYAACLNDLAWLLATCPELKARNPTRALDLAAKAVKLAPKEGGFWDTLGVAHYRTGDWQAAVAALNKAVELRRGGNAVDWLFLAMAHRRLGDHLEARKWYDQAVQWLDRFSDLLEKAPQAAAELRRFRSEAEEVLRLKKP